MPGGLPGRVTVPLMRLKKDLTARCEYAIIHAELPKAQMEHSAMSEVTRK